MEDINKPIKLLLIFVAIAIPLLLIIKQPDYGTAMAFCVALFMMLFTSGLDKKYIIGALIIICILIPILYNFILPEHAKKRIDIFLNPESDPRGSRIQYNTIKISNRSRWTNRYGIIKRKSNSIRILISKNNRLYILSNRRRNGIYNSAELL